MFDSVEKFRDVHKGKIGYVLGSGPSLSKYNLEKVSESGIIFSCNGSVVLPKNPDYFVFTDGAIPYYNFYDEAVNKSKNVIFAGRGIDYKFYNENINGYNEKIKFTANKHLVDRRYHPNGIPFIHNNDKNSANFDFVDGKLIDGSDVCMVVAHLAYICGCNPIYLLGVDLIWNGYERYFQKFDETLKQRKESPYSYEDNIEYFKKLDNGSSGGLKNSFNSWQKIIKENNNLPIINTNPEGLLSSLMKTEELKKLYK